MIKKIIKFFRPVLLFIARSWWYVIRPKTSGAKVIIRNQNEILLIKTTYGYNYSLPGGGCKKNEIPENAAKRETMEEVGILLDDITPLPSFVTHEEYKEDTVYSFYSEVTNKNYKLDFYEIDKAEWHSLDNLPKLGLVTGKIVNLYKNKASI